MSRSTSSPHRSMRTGGRRPVDGNTSTIEPAHGDLAPVLDLVLAAVAGGDEALDEVRRVELVAGPDDDRLDVLDVGAEALHEGPDRGDEHRGACGRGRGAATWSAAGGPWSRRSG